MGHDLYFEGGPLLLLLHLIAPNFEPMRAARRFEFVSFVAPRLRD